LLNYCDKLIKAREIVLRCDVAPVVSPDITEQSNPKESSSSASVASISDDDIDCFLLKPASRDEILDIAI
jgi:hypothetical protein